MGSRFGAPGLFLALAVAVGCNSGPGVYDVTGTVSLDGVPIEDGEIVFVAADNGTAPGAARIERGAFALKLPAGKKKVKIAASRKVPGKGAMGDDFVYQSYVPAQFNEQTTLEAEVAPGGANRFDFKLDTKAKTGG
jgi:hypothetical protein